MTPTAPLTTAAEIAREIADDIVCMTKTSTEWYQILTTYAAQVRRAQWQDIATAPKDATEVIVFTDNRAGCKGMLIAHWAHGGGDEQPAFGPAWFYWTGYSFAEMVSPPKYWMPLPSPPGSPSSQTDTGDK